MTARIAILHAPGTNRDGEAARAVSLAGGSPEVVHVLAGGSLGAYDGVIVPGGFSYGDALGAGTRLALELSEELHTFAASGRPVLGICNGFQALVKSGLLPGGDGDRRVTLTHNASGRFVCRWVSLASEPGNRSGLASVLPPVIACPVAHGEGRIAVTESAVVDELAANGNVWLRYVEGTNPNGSAGDIAGLVNDAGNVWGLMPHPEDHVTDEQNAFPDRPGRGGLGLFEAFVARAGEAR